MKDYIKIFSELDNKYRLFDVQSLGEKLMVSFRDINGNKNDTIIHDFRPYFYVPKSKIKYHKPFLKEKECIKIECNHPAEVKQEREKYEYTYEADILYDYRFHFDILNKFEENINIQPRIWIIDIEVFNKYEKTFPKPENKYNFISSIAIYDNYEDKYIVIAKVPNKKYNVGTIKDGNKYIIKVDSEKKLINIFIKLLREINPDILTGWNILLFDIPFIVERINIWYNNYLKKLSPFNIEPRKNENRLYNVFEYEIPGYVVLDYQILYENYGDTLPKYSLEVVSQHELKKGKVKFEKSLDHLYENDFEKFLKYNTQDIVLVKEINEKLDFLGLVNTLKSITYTKLYSFNFGNTLKVGDSLIMKYIKNMLEDVYVMKTKTYGNNKGGYKGAIVREPLVGLYYDYIIDFDATSMYPSIIRTLNISPETFILQVIEDRKFISEKLRPYLHNNDNNSLDDKVCEVLFEDENVRKIELKKVKQYLYNKCNGNNFTIALNGSIFNNNKIGVLKMIEDDLFHLRNKTKDIKKFFGKLQNVI